MDWQQIVGFYHVATLGSFTRAAEATFRTQSALSQQIKSLEEELDCRLLERIGKRKLRLTVAGETFLNFARETLKRHEHLVEELHELKGTPKGRLRIAAPFTTLYHLLPVPIREYTEQFPQVELKMLDRPQQDVFALVRSGDVDLGLALESEVPAELAVLRWQAVETVLMVPSDHPLAAAVSVTLEQVAACPLILPPRESKLSSRKLLEERLRELGAKYHVILESSNVELSSLYVEMGLGISFATVVRDLPALRQRRLKFIPVAGLPESDHIAVVMRKDKTLPSYKKSFLDILFREPPRGSCTQSRRLPKVRRARPPGVAEEGTQDSRF
jgi:DNA-binding transcriptional LysR family regulator